MNRHTQLALNNLTYNHSGVHTGVWWGLVAEQIQGAAFTTAVKFLNW